MGELIRSLKPYFSMISYYRQCLKTDEARAAYAANELSNLFMVEATPIKVKQRLWPVIQAHRMENHGSR